MLGLFRWATVASLLWLLPSALQAQYPRARRGEFEVSGLDFRRDGAWRKRVDAIRSARHRLLRARALAELNRSASPSSAEIKVTGHYFIPVIPIAFRNAPPPYTVAQYQRLLFSPNPSGRPYTLKTFYEELSNRNITLGGRVLGWVTADSNDSYYEDGCNGIGVLGPCPPRPVSRFGELLLQTLDAVSQGPTGTTLWTEFDNDGPDGLPNSGDDDGFVDFVTFLQPDLDGACPSSPHIWAHRFVVRAWNGGSPYITRTPWAGHPGRFLKVDEYTIQSALGGDTACDPSAPMPIGTVAHETGHAFGLPDLYDTDLNSSSKTQGIGEWGLMGSGNYARPYSPSRFEAWSLVELGWVDVDTLSSGRDVQLGPVASTDTVLYLPVPGANEYFLLENRQPEESDSAQMNPAFTRRKSPGLLIWHIDQGQVDRHGFAIDNRVNVGPTHGVALVQADGLDDLSRPGGTDRGDTGDAFPGSTGNSSICKTTTPPAKDNQGGFAWFCLDSIRQIAPGGPVAFRYVSFHSVFASDHTGAVIAVNGARVSRLDQFFPPGTAIELSADSVQSGASERSRFEFLGWSDGGDRTHAVTARQTPDTIVAQLTAEHRLRMSVQGSTLLALRFGITGDVASGVFVAEGTRVSIAAAPQPETVFVGWTGDTTATSDTLTLIMAHPFDITANFLAVQNVALADAAGALLGKSELGMEQRTFLDAVGNRNGAYDLGDFLAAVERSAIPTASPLAERLIAGSALPHGMTR